MCGIVGYTGPRQAAPLLLKSLAKLEYRGYDSSGIALASGDGLFVKKAMGRLSVLSGMMDGGKPFTQHAGIGHTRWATHGEPSDLNSHPHMSHSKRVAIVHNGIVENYAELKVMLTERGYTFTSQTDTEVAAQLIDYCYRGDPVSAAREAVSMLAGSFALAIMFADFPDQIIAVRKDSPLIVGLGTGENFIASDVPAILSETRDVIRLNEYELAVITPQNVTVFDRLGNSVKKEPEHISWNADAAEKGGYEHFMLKEIMEQPSAIKNTVYPRIHDGEINLDLKHLSADEIKNIDRIFVIACGSAAHVGHVGRLFLERYAHVPVTVELASEFRYIDPIVTERTLAIVISQSGETIDTLLALREAKQRGSKVIGVVNVVGSSIANECSDVVYTWAGPEIAVATTKAYSTQLCVMYMIALYLGRVRGNVDDALMKESVAELERLPELIGGLLGQFEHCQQLASLFFNLNDIFFIGRNLDYALALEGSLKLKEISYVHSEAYAAGELKHGTISLVQNGTLVVALCTYEPLLDKMKSNIKEVEARGARVIAILPDGCEMEADFKGHVIRLPKAKDLVMPSLAVVPMQMFAYYVALLRGCDIDKPRNLAKSVTVE